MVLKGDGMTPTNVKFTEPTNVGFVGFVNIENARTNENNQLGKDKQYNKQDSELKLGSRRLEIITTFLPAAPAPGLPCRYPLVQC
jgi:hypothetical protein